MALKAQLWQVIGSSDPDLIRDILRELVKKDEFARLLIAARLFIRDDLSR